MTLMNPGTESVVVHEVSAAEGQRHFELACQRELGVSADAFLRHHDSGSIPANWPAQAVQRVEFLLPFVR